LKKHYFCLGSIPKPKPNWPILLADTVTDTETTFQKIIWTPIVRGIFFIIKGPLIPNLMPYITDFYIVFEDLCSTKQENMRKIEKSEINLNSQNKY
jgi:hypothetical protein